MKILLFRSDPSIMNIDSYNSQEIGLAKAYIKKGHSCDIVYYNGKEKSRIQEIKADEDHVIRIYWMKGFSILNNGFFPGISKLVEQYDIIQVSEYYFWGSWYIYKKFMKKKIVYVYQGVYDSDYSTRYKIRCKIMDPLMLTKNVKTNLQIFTKSKLAEDSMRTRGFLHVNTVGVGLDSDRLNPIRHDHDTSEFLNNIIKNKEDYTYLLYVGVLEERRNILFMLDVLKAVVTKKPNVRLIIVGKGQSDYMKNCKNKVYALDLEPYIIYKDSLSQTELMPLYNVADIFLLPSKYEIFGMVLLEAMSFGLNVVTSMNGGSMTIIDNGENGWIIKDFSAESWENIVLELIDDRNLRRRIAEAAEKTAAEDFSWNSIASKILNEIT